MSIITNNNNNNHNNNNNNPNNNNNNNNEHHNKNDNNSVFNITIIIKTITIYRLFTMWLKELSVCNVVLQQILSPNYTRARSIAYF